MKFRTNCPKTTSAKLEVIPQTIRSPGVTFSATNITQSTKDAFKRCSSDTI
jgi:hypothetical protein